MMQILEVSNQQTFFKFFFSIVCRGHDGYMRSNKKFKVGDIFRVNLGDNKYKYFQFIGLEESQLNSEVIRVFQKVYSADDNLDLSKLINESVEFYAHCVLKWGVQYEYWEKVGHLDLNSVLDLIFLFY